MWKHPNEDFNSLTELIVHESQEAVFFMNGQALDLFGPGRYTLETQNIPKLGKLLNRATGDQTPFHCEVYFINKTVQMSLKWGTDTKVRYIEPDSGIPVELGACGNMNLMVSDSRKLLIKLVGTMDGIAWDDNNIAFSKSLQDCFRLLITDTVSFVGIIACAVVLGAYIIAVAKAKLAIEAVEQTDAKIKTQTQFIRLLTADAESLKGYAADDNAKQACDKVYDAVRYSDPVSNPLLSGIESDISVKFSAFSDSVKNKADNSRQLAEELCRLMSERNAKVKALK